MPLNYKTAAQWFTHAANKGDATSRYELGLLYYQGLGVAQDYESAFKWFELAAEQGYAKAQFSLGLMYERGDGVSQDKKSSERWHSRAKKQGLLNYLQAADAYKNGQNASALFHFEHLAEMGDMRAQRQLGLMYSQGIGGSKNMKTAIRWWSRAAAQGDISSLYSLGWIYESDGELGTALACYKFAFNNGANDARDKISQIIVHRSGRANIDAFQPEYQQNRHTLELEDIPQMDGQREMAPGYNDMDYKTGLSAGRRGDYKTALRV